MTAELKKLIDEQNLEALQEYLDLHPHLDLDHVTDTGLSALWWAIYPPQDKIVSQEIIQCLIDKRVDPTQRMYGQGIDKSLSDVSVSILLRNYANREYIHSTKKNTQELQNIAQDSQNTHNSLVVQQFNDFISNLYQRYVLTKKTNLSWDDNFDVFAKKHNSSPILQKAINRIQADTGGYPLEGQDKSLSNAELLMLVWYALNDTDTAHYVTGCSMSVEDQTKRKVDLLNFLVEAQTAYGKNNPACFMGTRHKIISTLDKIHIDCEGSTQKLSKEKFQELYDIFCAEAITVLQTENPSLYASFAATYAPTTQEIPADVLVFVDATKKNFKKSIEEHQHSLLDSHKMPADIFEPLKTLYTSEDIPLSVTMHPVVSKVTRFWDQEPQLRKIGALQKEVPLCPTIDVLHTASGFQDWVKTHYSEDKSSVLAYLNSEPLCQKFLSATPAAEKITETLWQDILSVSLANTEIDLSQQFPLAVLHPYLSEHWKAQLDDKKLLEWLNCLSNESKVAFYQALYATENPDIAAIAFHIAQEQGFWSHFPLQQEIIFKDKDLRGMDFRTLDLSHCTFENCDLRMTGILENPTLKSQHLDTSIIEIPIEKSLGFFAVYYSCIGAMNVFLEKFPEYIKNQSIHGNTILHIASRLERHEMTLAILEKNSSSEFVQMENDCGSTALHRAASSGRTEVVTAILNKNSSLEFLQMKDICGMTALHRAAWGGHTEVVTAILNKNSSLEFLQMKDIYGKTALHRAASSGRTEVVTAILNKNSSLQLAQMKDDNGDTALHIAVAVADFPSVQVFTQMFNAFLEKDDDLISLDAKNDQNKTPLQLFKLLHPSKSKKIILSLDLCRALKAMRVHAEKLGEPYKTNIVPLVKQLKESAFAYMKTSDAQEKTKQQAIFKQTLDKLLPHTKGHRKRWKPILANLLIAATGIGIFVIAIHYAATRQHFFERTKRREILDTIDKLASDKSINIKPAG